MNYKRKIFLDEIKGLAMILTVFGHAIQNGSGAEFYENQLYFDNSMFKFIYSFHMPLFMLVSGYLFSYSIKDSVKFFSQI